MTVKKLGAPLNGMSKEDARAWLEGLRTAEPKTSTPRVAAMRSNRTVAGLTRWELSPPPHLDDRPEIKALAERLARKRAKLARQQAG